MSGGLFKLVTMSGGIYKDAPILERLFRPTPKPIPRPIPRRNPRLTPHLQVPVMENRPKWAVEKLCQAESYCKTIEESYGAINSEDHRMAQKKNARNELDKILEDSSFWQTIGLAEAIANCIDKKVTCSCLDVFTEKKCSG